MDNYHLTKKGDHWLLKKAGAERASKTFDDKATAVRESAAFMRQRGGSLKVHKADGTIQEERTYPRSADPTKSRG